MIRDRRPFFYNAYRGWGCLLLALLLCAACESQDRDHELLKSPNDPRAYRSLVLDNGLKVILISDPDTDKAAAALDVNAGSNSDPLAYQGLSHFLEHMLFLGTDRYPESGEYQAYISSHGGTHNAYTAFENTNYYFDIDKDYLAPALERFSRFFIAPLFTQDYVERERHAVNAEYQSNLESDGRRAYEVFKAVLNPDHPLAKFSVGSLETLADDGQGSLRQALIDHYQAYYSATQMSLAVLGKESLDQLENDVRTYFSELARREVMPLHTDQALFREGDLPAMLEIIPVRNSRSLTYTFPIPPTRAHYREKPVSYLANLLGHEGEGSLLSLLRARGWVNGLSAGDGLSHADTATFEVNLSLTEEGMERLEDITGLLFQTLDLIREQGLRPWRYREQQSMAQLAFRFQEPARPLSYVGSLSRRLQEYPATEVIRAAYAYDNYNPELINHYLDFLRPDNMLITLSGQTLESDSVEPRFGAAYRFRRLARQDIESWLEGSREKALQMPEPNPFLPDDLELKNLGDGGPKALLAKPALILDQDGVRLWFRQDDGFRVPRANFYLYAKTPLFNNSLENSLLADFSVSLLNDKLNEYSYPASLAGLSYGVSSRARGFSVRVSGYDDKQTLLLTEILKTFQAADFSAERFEIIKAEYIRSWENADKRMPYSRLLQDTQSLLIDPYWSEEEKIAAARELSVEDVKNFIPAILQNLNIDALYHGNVTEEEALAMLAIARRTLGATASAPDAPFAAVLKLPERQRLALEIEVDHDDSAIVLYLQGEDDSLATRARVRLLSRILQAPFFDTLRTEKQLGYVVNVGTLSVLKVAGLAFYIESPVAGPLDLEQHIDEFLQSYADTLANMGDSEFATLKAGYLNELRQKPQRLSSLSGRFWNDILTEYYEEDSVELLAAAVESLSLAEIRDFYRSRVSDTAAGRLAARAVGRVHRQGVAANKRRQEPEFLIENSKTFKQESEKFYY